MVLQRLLQPAAGKRLLWHHNDAGNVLSAVLTGASTAEAGAACNKVPFNPINLLHSRVHTTNATMHASTYTQDDEQAAVGPFNTAKPNVPPTQAIATYIGFLRNSHPQLLTPAPVATLLEQGRAAASAWSKQVEGEEEHVQTSVKVPAARKAAVKAAPTKARVTSWNMFIKHHALRATNDGARAPTTAALSKLWKALPDADKQMFVDMAAAENSARGK